MNFCMWAYLLHGLQAVAIEENRAMLLGHRHGYPPPLPPSRSHGETKGSEKEACKIAADTLPTKAFSSVLQSILDPARTAFRPPVSPSANALRSRERLTLLLLCRCVGHMDKGGSVDKRGPF